MADTPDSLLRDASPLVQDLIPSPPATPAAATMPPHSIEGKRVITTHDLRRPSCWICRDDDEDDEGSEALKAVPRVQAEPTKGKRRFVHPCQCTLVAHESCLFQWIETRKNRLSETPACPQCKRAYIIKSPRPLALRLFESCDVMMQQVLPYLGYAAASGAIVTTLTVYGAAAYTVWMGSTTASRELLGKWHWKVWLRLPAVPLCMMASRLPGGRDYMNLLGCCWSVSSGHGPVAFLTMGHDPMYLPLAMLPPMSEFPLFREDSASGRLQFHTPGPEFTAFIFPWVRVVYGLLRSRFTRWLLKPLVKQRSSAQSRTTPQNSSRRQSTYVAAHGRRVRFVLGENARADTDGELNDHIPHGVQSVTERDTLEDDVPEVEPISDPLALRARYVETYYISAGSFARLALETLSLPFIAAGIGEGLSLIARRFRPGNWLESFLGISRRSAKPSKFPRPGQEESNHWRNTVSLWLYVVTRDSFALAYRYLRLKQRRKAQIKDLPFDDRLVPSLDLV